MKIIINIGIGVCLLASCVTYDKGQVNSAIQEENKPDFSDHPLPKDIDPEKYYSIKKDINKKFKELEIDTLQNKRCFILSSINSINEEISELEKNTLCSTEKEQLKNRKLKSKKEEQNYVEYKGVEAIFRGVTMCLMILVTGILIIPIMIIAGICSIVGIFGWPTIKMKSYKKTTPKGEEVKLDVLKDKVKAYRYFLDNEIPGR